MGQTQIRHVYRPISPFSSQDSIGDLQKLSPDLLIYLSKYLNDQSLGRYFRLSKKFYFLSRSNELWKERISVYFSSRYYFSREITSTELSFVSIDRIESLRKEILSNHQNDSDIARWEKEQVELQKKIKVIYRKMQEKRIQFNKTDEMLITRMNKIKLSSEGQKELKYYQICIHGLDGTEDLETIDFLEKYASKKVNKKITFNPGNLIKIVDTKSGYTAYLYVSNGFGLIRVWSSQIHQFLSGIFSVKITLIKDVYPDPIIIE